MRCIYACCILDSIAATPLHNMEKSLDDLYTTADFLTDVTVTYWGGDYADELLAVHFGWSVA